MLNGKKILIGVSGGIAAYKIPLLVRLLVKSGAEVKLILTKDAENFVTKQTLSVLSKNKVEEPFFDENGTWNNHVQLGLWPDIMLIAPATANTLAKMAHGLCDNFLLATYLSTRCPVMVAPAMDEDMYLHFSTEESIKKLKEKNHFILIPNTGELASGLNGKGRMQEPEEIHDSIYNILLPAFKGKKVLINAGPTYEPIDPVRFIGNRSSGKTGIYLAEAFTLISAEVKLILGPSSENTSFLKNSVINVETAQEMYEACLNEFPSVDLFIASAAVSDFRPEIIHTQKIKKEANNDFISLKLVKNPDILAEAGKIKTDRQKVVGFALETDDQIENARKKLINKNLDLVILNSANTPGEGFGYNTNRITLIDKNNKITKFELMHKRQIAIEIAKFLSNSF